MQCYKSKRSISYLSQLGASCSMCGGQSVEVSLVTPCLRNKKETAVTGSWKPCTLHMVKSRQTSVFSLLWAKKVVQNILTSTCVKYFLQFPMERSYHSYL